MMYPSNSISTFVRIENVSDLIHYVLIPYSNYIFLAYFEVVSGFGHRHSLEQVLQL